MRIQPVFLAVVENNGMASDSVKRPLLKNVSLPAFLKSVLAALSFWLSGSAAVVPIQYLLLSSSVSLIRIRIFYETCICHFMF